MNNKKNKCVFCNKKSNLYKKYKEKNKIFSNMDIFFCNICDLYYSCPLPSNSELNYYYNSTLEVSIGSKNSGKLNVSFANLLAKLRVKFIKENIKFDSKINVLEFGSGYGHLANYFLKSNIVRNYYAIESDERCYEALKKINLIIYKNVDNINFKINFDILILSHILEHLTDPINFIISLKKKYNIKYIFIDVPCEDFKYKEFDIGPLVLYTKDDTLPTGKHPGNVKTLPTYTPKTADDAIDWSEFDGGNVDYGSIVVEKTGTQIGAIAQELEAVCPGCVTTQSTGVKAVDTDELFWHLVNAVKELSTKVKALEAG